MRAAVSVKKQEHPGETVKKQSQLGEILKRLCRNKTAMVGSILFIIILILGLLAPYISPYGYAEMDLVNRFGAPSSAHWFGQDDLGRDILTRVLWGTRYSLGLGFASMAFAFFFGTILGCVAGYYGGRFESMIMRFCDVWQSIPHLVMTILIATAFGTGWLNTVFAMGISEIPSACRTVRAQFLSIREEQYVEAEHAINASSARIMFKHMLPNALAPLIVNMTLGIGNNIMQAASLSYLGLGVQSPTPEWGAMITAGRDYLRNYPHLVLFPGLALAITIIAVNIFGDGLRDAIDPKLKN